MNTKTIAIELTFGRQGTKHLLRAAQEMNSQPVRHIHILCHIF